MSAPTRGPSRLPLRAVGRTRWRRGLAGVAALAIPVLLAGCSLPAPAGNAPLRYRDVIFPTVNTQDNITYGQAPDATGTITPQQLDLYTPSGDTQTSRPAIVIVHGGGFRGGDKQDYGVTLLANTFAQRGYVAVSINYPLLVTSEVCSKEAVPSQTCVNAAFAAQHAAQAAIRYLRANATQYGVDPNRVAVEGTSAGAVTALAVAVNSNDPGTDGNPGYSSYANASMAISGELPDFAKAFYDPSDSPVLMFNGTADQTVPYANAAATAQAMVNAGVPVIFETLPGSGHVPFSTDKQTLLNQSVYFAYDFLHLDQAAGQPASAARAAKAQQAKLARDPAVKAFLRKRAQLDAARRHAVRHRRAARKH